MAACKTCLPQGWLALNSLIVSLRQQIKLAQLEATQQGPSGLAVEAVWTPEMRDSKWLCPGSISLVKLLFTYAWPHA